MVEDLKSQGLSQKEIARAMGFAKYDKEGNITSYGTTEFRNRRTVALNEQKAARIAQAERLAATGMSNAAIAKEMGLPNESSVRALRAPGQKDKNVILNATVNKIKEEIDKKDIVDIGASVAYQMGISTPKLNAAVQMLQEEGYLKSWVNVPQLGTKWETRMIVLAKPGITHKEIQQRKFEVKQIVDYSTDGGRTYENKLHYPNSISSNRIAVKWKEDGGGDADGMIYVRPGVADTSLGKSTYAQVRILVDGTHYLKGMAMYKDDLPRGVDLEFHTNKSKTESGGDKIKAMKPIEKNTFDPLNPFNSAIRRQNGVMNILNEEGQWEPWSKSFSSQFLSKQPHKFAEEQLAVTFQNKKAEYEEIMSLTNPVVKKKMLEEFADSADSLSVELSAVGLPRTATHVLLPSPHVKENEIYAPNYNNGDRVALVRHPHAGPFEIPNLVVNNRNPKARKMFGNVSDAVAINVKAAQKLSGADFDGDTVLVIKNNRGKVKHQPVLEGLKDFDPKGRYPHYEGMRTIDGGIMKNGQVVYGEKGPNAATKQHEMGKISNLITDMSVKGASGDELAAAIRHSMVVIDSEKHHLNYKQSELDNGIKALKTKWQGSAKAGASTLISRAAAEARVPERKQLVTIDKATGKKVYRYTEKSFIDKQGKLHVNTTKSNQMSEVDNAFDLIRPKPGTVIESVYATHANRLKAAANQARKEAVNMDFHKYSPSANRAYAKEVASLKAQLLRAQKNAPLERQAQVIGNAKVKQVMDANPNMDKDTIKKLKHQALKDARAITGAGKTRIKITDEEWAAIQAGAISNAMLTNILKNADMDVVKKLATPKQKLKMTSVKLSAAQNMLSNGYTQAEVAEHLGVSLSTLKRSLGTG
jgi:transcriptional regulator with XRE-family HTH domain